MTRADEMSMTPLKTSPGQDPDRKMDWLQRLSDRFDFRDMPREYFRTALINAPAEAIEEALNSTSSSSDAESASSEESSAKGGALKRSSSTHQRGDKDAILRLTKLVVQESARHHAFFRDFTDPSHPPSQSGRRQFLRDIYDRARALSLSSSDAEEVSRTAGFTFRRERALRKAWQAVCEAQHDGGSTRVVLSEILSAQPWLVTGLRLISDERAGPSGGSELGTEIDDSNSFVLDKSSPAVTDSQIAPSGLAAEDTAGNGLEKVHDTDSRLEKKAKPVKTTKDKKQKKTTESNGPRSFQKTPDPSQPAKQATTLKRAKRRAKQKEQRGGAKRRRTQGKRLFSAAQLEQESQVEDELEIKKAGGSTEPQHSSSDPKSLMAEPTFIDFENYDLDSSDDYESFESSDSSELADESGDSESSADGSDDFTSSDEVSDDSLGKLPGATPSSAASPCISRRPPARLGLVENAWRAVIKSEPNTRDEMDRVSKYFTGAPEFASPSSGKSRLMPVAHQDRTAVAVPREGGAGHDESLGADAKPHFQNLKDSQI